jgi:endonuclease-3
MATPNRSALLAKLPKVLRKHYKPVPADLNRPVLEQVLFALCLENSHYPQAQAAFAALAGGFFDWNEVRVSSVKELSEVMQGLPDPAVAAAAVRQALQGVFESMYSFDLEALRKQPLGQAQQKLQKVAGVSPFALACVTQWALGGHAIPLDRGALETLVIVGIIDEAQRDAGAVPGLERAIPKNKGIEFGSLLHQLGADLVAGPYSANLHKLLLEINPEAKSRLPKRQAKKPPEEPPAPVPAPLPVSKGKAKPPAAAAPPAEQKRSTANKSRPPVKKKPAAVEKRPVKRKAAAAVAKRKPR